MSLVPCQDCDGRLNCSSTTPSTCVDYVGKVSTLIKNLIPCRPNLNDVLEQLQKLMEDIKRSLGDNRLLDKKCLTFNNLIVTQKELNQVFIDKLCELETAFANIGDTLTIDAINVTMDINLLCIENELCDPLTTYTLSAILLKMVTKICNLETRVTAIETFLGL